MKKMFFRLVWYVLKKYSGKIYNAIVRDDNCEGRERCPKCGSVEDYDTHYGGESTWAACKRCGYSRED